MPSPRRSTRIALTVAPWIVLGALTLAVPFGLATYASQAEPAAWRLKDWTAVLSSTALGIIFFVLALTANRGSRRRARAAADSALLRTVGALETSSARVFAGDDRIALTLSADSRAALQQLPFASEEQQLSLISTIKHAYSNLIFSSLSRSDELPRSIYEELTRGVRSILDDIAVLEPGLPEATRGEIVVMRRHIEFAGILASRVRARAAGREKEISTFDTTWFNREFSAKLEIFRTLYERELTVVHDWSLLTRYPVDLHVRDEPVRPDSDTWLAPWYLKPNRDGSPGAEPVNVAGRRLGSEIAARDRVRHSTPERMYPEAIPFERLPAEIRASSISRLEKLLVETDQVVVPVLLYTTFDGTSVVLDGNHRLAAARRIAGRFATKRVRALVFEIREQPHRKPVLPVCDRTSATVNSDDPFAGWRWEGFTPDVTLLHRQREIVDHLITPDGPPLLTGFEEPR